MVRSQNKRGNTGLGKVKKKARSFFPSLLTGPLAHTLSWSNLYTLAPLFWGIVKVCRKHGILTAVSTQAYHHIIESVPKPGCTVIGRVLQLRPVTRLSHGV
jgi:hypothetical protein